MNKVSLALVIHSHQPVGNFDHVFEGATRKAYAPFLRLLSQHPRIRVSLHYSGILLEWLEARHPEFFDQLRRLIERHQVELVGGGYFEPVLPAIPDRDKRRQMERLREAVERHFGRVPTGLWLAERVWESTLARPLAEAGLHRSPAPKRSDGPCPLPPARPSCHAGQAASFLPSCRRGARGCRRGRR